MCECEYIAGVSVRINSVFMYDFSVYECLYMCMSYHRRANALSHAYICKRSRSLATNSYILKHHRAGIGLEVKVRVSVSARVRVCVNVRVRGYG